MVALLYFFFCASLGVVGWLFLLTAAFFIGVYTAGSAAREWGEDPGRVVVDEGVGFLVTVAFLPHGWETAVAGFFLFRLLDIVKPPPVRQCERLPGGWGIVADDVAAGIYGNLLIRAGICLLGKWQPG